MDQLDQLHADAQITGHHLGHLKTSSVPPKENKKTYRGGTGLAFLASVAVSRGSSFFSIPDPES
jgi:hypothetical protein